MAFTAYPGSVIVFGQAPAQPGTPGTTDYNTTDGPSLFNCGALIMDPRKIFTYNPGNNYGGSSNALPVYGWLGTGGDIPLIDQAPTTISTNSIAQTQAVTSSTPLTLTASNTNNVTLTTIVAPESGATISVLAIDGAMGTVTFGSDASIAVWDPTKSISRCITITTTGNDLGATWSVAGRDLYGIKVTESISASSSAATLTSKKAYKYISSITPVTTGTFGSTSVVVGVSDTYGLPMYVSNGAYASIFLNNISISSTDVTAGMGLATVATSTTADVRGTWASTTASNGTNRIIAFVTPSVAAMNTTINGDVSHGIIGALQFSSV